MTDPTETTLPPARATTVSEMPARAFGWRNFALAVLALIAAFCLPLRDLVTFSLHSELYSHALLIPCISLYLVWLNRSRLPPSSPPDYRLAILPFILGSTLLALRLTTALNQEDTLAFTILAFVLFFAGICTLFLGPPTLRVIAFPLCFLVFMAPFPTGLMEGIESFLQHASASAAYLFFTFAGTTIFREDTFFQLPGMKLFVAPECSGVHSTLALFITSLLAGYFFLRSPVNRAILTLVVIPLAIVRNGFRILVIGELCVHVGPHMIDSYIHRQGGPIFFALSLIPFSGFLWLLIKMERRRSRASS